MALVERAEAAFESWGRTVVTHPWVTLLLSLLAVAMLSSQLPEIRFETNLEAFLAPDHPVLVATKRFQEEFPRDDVVLVGIETENVYDLAFLEKLRALHEEIEREVPWFEEVTSLINARSTYGRDDELVVEGLLESWPQNAADLAQLRKRIASNPLYVNSLVSEDARLTTLIVLPAGLRDEIFSQAQASFDFEDAPLLADGEEASSLIAGPEVEMLHTLRKVAARHDAPGFKIHLAGLIIMAEHLGFVMQDDITRFATISVLAIAILLYVLFRRLSGVFVPLTVVIVSSTSTLGLMSLFGVPLSVVTEILPTFILAVGVCDSVHVLTIAYQRLDLGDSRQDAIVFSLRHSGLAILMTSLTTAAGLLSFMVAEVQPVFQLGIFAPVGVVLALAFTLTLLPALLAVLPLRGRARLGASARTGWLDRAIVGLGDVGFRFPRTVVAISAALIVFSLAGAVQLRISFNPLNWFPAEDPLRVASSLVDEHLSGSIYLDLLLDTERENGLYDPELLHRIERLTRWAEAYEGEARVGRAMAITDLIKEIHRALNENRQEEYRIPDDRKLIAQELLLFEASGSDDLADLADTTYQRARLNLVMPRVDAVHYVGFLEDLSSATGKILGDGVVVTATGGIVLLAQTTMDIAISMMRSYALALLAITPLMILLVGRLRLGLLSMIPNLAPVVLTMGVMYWTGVPLDATTLLIGSIVLGLAVDDTIHFLHRFDRYLAETGDVRAAVRETLTTTGSALLFTSLVLAGGFFVFGFGYMKNISYFGLLVGFAALVAFLADVLLVPAMLALGASRLGLVRTFDAPVGASEMDNYSDRPLS